MTTDEIEGRLALAQNGDLKDLLHRLRERAEPVLERMPAVPQVKAMLTRDGGQCPDCNHPLEFDPWEPDLHRCSSCGKTATGPRHHAHWARHQHLWLAERAAELAAVGVFADDRRAIDRSRELLAAYHDLYFALPNRDNVLGPSHLFFSTYLESMWVLSYLAAAYLLRERGLLDEAEIEAVNEIADEAANLIGEFNEGMSNRQTWNSAALTAIAAWFGDDELAGTAIQSATGLLGHLTDGFGVDGLWFEGENYHLFAIRGLMLGFRWARALGIDVLEHSELAAHFADALMAPSLSALPDLTFPARKDSRYGVSLAQPAYLECWEAGYGWLGEDVAGLSSWLHALYQAPVRPAATYDAYLHDAGRPARETIDRADLSWWMLFEMAPALPPDTLPWTPGSRWLESQRLAVLRRDDRYVSLECGSRGEGHGHPDLMHLTVYAGGVHWLPDPGAGSYVTRDLFWYRSSLAHNAPRLTGTAETASGPDAAFDQKGDWGWAQVVAGPLQRSVVLGPSWIGDVVEATAPGDVLELPWHFQGEVTVETPGSWAPGEIASDFVSDVETFTPAAEGAIRVRAELDGRRVGLWLLGGTLLRGRCPGLPNEPASATLLLVRTPADGARVGAVIDLDGTVTAAALNPEHLAVASGDEAIRVAFSVAGATVEAPGSRVALGGYRPWVEPPKSAIYSAIYERGEPVVGEAMRLDHAPVLDGSFDGFDLSAPIELADELHYFRSEDPYDSPEELSAEVHVNWDERALYLGVLVRKPEVIVRAPGAPPLQLDNEPEDIHSDGIQVYFRKAGVEPTGYLIRPADDGGLWARAIPGTPDEPVTLRGSSVRTEDGYAMTVELPCPGLTEVDKQEIEFDLLVNEMRPDRLRRAGQLAWSGGAGWIYLRGDRRPAAPFGTLRLVS